MKQLHPPKADLRFRASVCALIVACAIVPAKDALSLERIELAPEGIGRPSDRMGSTVVLFGDTAAVAAPGTQLVNGVNSGVVDIYRLQSGVWSLETMLSPPAPFANQYFGRGVALGPDLLVVADEGKLHTFERNGSTWQHVDEIDAFTWEQIDLSGDTLVSAGSVYVRSGSTWELQAQLETEGLESGFAGMAIDGDLIVAATAGGGPFHSNQSAYFFSRSGTTWTQEGRLQLGLTYTPVHVAISGHTALVSAEDPLLHSSVRVFDRDDTGNWIDHGTLDTGVNLAWEVPVSIEGDVAVVGSPADNTAYTFVRSNGTWSRDLHFNDPYSGCFWAVAIQGSTVLAGCPNSYSATEGYGIADFFSIDQNPPPVVAQFGQGDAHANEMFGFRVAAGGDTLLATAGSGTYFYEHTASGWTQTNTFPPLPLTLSAASAAMDGDTAAVGYPVQIFPGGSSGITVYARAAGNWSLQATIPGSPVEGSYFAGALALQGDVLVAGDTNVSTGASTCHVYLRSGASWQGAPDLNPAGGMSGDGFCSSIAMSGNTLLVGAPKSDVGIEFDAGIVYVFERSGNTWTQQAPLLAPLVPQGAQFGASVAIKGDTAIVGSVNATRTRGEVNVYHRSVNGWTWQAALEPPVDGNAPGDFGFIVAVSDSQNRVLVTAPSGLADNPLAGVAFAFAFDGTEWSPTATIYAAPPFPRMTDDLFGWSATFFGDQFVIGAPQDAVGGAVYVGPTSEVIFSNGFDSSP
ncbi:MAG: FG-GAP repeat protein [Rhodanobacteraceae bacterium]